MNILDTIKAKLKAALARFAQRKAGEQAEGMEQEARGIVAGVQDLAKRNPAGFAILVALGVGVLYLALRQRGEEVSTSL